MQAPTSCRLPPRAGSHLVQAPTSCRLPPRAGSHLVQAPTSCRLPPRSGSHLMQDPTSCRLPPRAGSHLVQAPTSCRLPPRSGSHLMQAHITASDALNKLAMCHNVLGLFLHKGGLQSYMKDNLSRPTDNIQQTIKVVPLFLPLPSLLSPYPSPPSPTHLIAKCQQLAVSQ